MTIAASMILRVSRFFDFPGSTKRLRKEFQRKVQTMF